MSHFPILFVMCQILTRRVRESRQELRKFQREVKKNNPAASCSLQYDKLYVDKKCYIFNTAEGRVVEHTVRRMFEITFLSSCFVGSWFAGKTWFGDGQILSLLFTNKAKKVSWPFKDSILSV